jgi:glutamate N-acetyltransferase/amino-acid N-acetyltransferase
MKIIRGGITAPKGFLASGIHCGIKYKNKDLALIYSQVPAVACGVFTQNRLRAAPVELTQAHLKNSRAQAVIINSGNANCCTGKQGLDDARRMGEVAARQLRIDAQDVLVASTGIIGKKLPLEKIAKKAAVLVKRLSPDASLEAAQAIMTTDTRVKQISVQVNLGGKGLRIGGIAKGAGMIAPHLATMLAFITTDAAIEKRRLKKALGVAVDNSFNLISVEGDTSTNDMVLVLANGLAGNKSLRARDVKTFQQALNFVCLSLAKMIVQDAEGASKFVQIQVQGARNIAQAKRIAFKVANSPLVKTAIFGENPNWGRIAAAAGCADKAIKPDRLSIYLGPVKVLEKGVALKVEQHRLRNIFRKADIQIKIVLGLGGCCARVFTCDLSHKYVDINARY